MLQFCLKHLKCCSLSSEGQFMLSEAKGRMSPARPYKAHNWDTAGLVSFSHFKGRTWDINHFPIVWSDVSLLFLKNCAFPSQNQVKDDKPTEQGWSHQLFSLSQTTVIWRVSQQKEFQVYLGLFCSCFTLYSYLLKNSPILQSCVWSKDSVYLYQ